MSDKIWQPETLYSSWLNNSILMMTAALVFYHMTRLNRPTLEVPPLVAAAISCGLILVDVCLSSSALIPYYLRTNEILSKPKDSTSPINYQQEKQFEIMYIILGLIITMLQIGICYYVIKDAINRSRSS